MVPDALHVIMWVGTADRALRGALRDHAERHQKGLGLFHAFAARLHGRGVRARATRLARTRARSLAIAAGVGAAMFHLTTHAFFKALLFLGSGSVIHGCHHEQDIFKMGGLRDADAAHVRRPSRSACSPSSAFPFLAGFFSKDAILYLAFANNNAVFAVLAFTAVLTALYMVRLWRIVFFGAAAQRSGGACARRRPRR